MIYLRPYQRNLKATRRGRDWEWQGYQPEQWPWSREYKPCHWQRCSPTWTQSTLHTALGTRSWSCAWSRWSSSVAWRTRPSSTRCSRSPSRTTAFPSQRRWRWWYKARRSGWTRLPRCSSWWWEYRWETSMTWRVWRHGGDGRIWAWRGRTHPRLTTLLMIRRRWGNQNSSSHPRISRN